MPRAAPRLHQRTHAPRYEPPGAECRYGQGRGGRPWRRRRERVLVRDSYLCQPCLSEGRLTLATAVDHIIPLSRGGTDADDNLQSICGVCHARKTQRETRGR